MIPNLTVFVAVVLANIISAQTKNPIDDGRKIRVPVVFHVLYTSGDENIPDSDIVRELDDLNKDFSATNDMSKLDPQFKNLAGNANIEFYILDKVFIQNGTKGVQRIKKVSGLNTDALLIDEKNCLNVFIANHGNASGILSDRVNLNYDDVGTHEHTMTHEAGHWLGLYHIFGQAGSDWFYARWSSSSNDSIDDTPEQSRSTDVKFRPVCPPKRRLIFDGHKTLYNNFMDYNACRCMFTMLQCTKMRNNIIKNKPALFKVEVE